ncbi:hypothetical protein SBOR_6310 [Sclerotinia borealis F-4128]|uniref:Reverse transcriptase domain-containing protein n=1 Tax=Sclerotinia borealis (strain F-4128) TaxID=1432307 RepID=W9CEW6_SCLBF|nr:hypothetical protein SBOR_6310 [Sclerotinia borealis F-4128]
MIPPKKKGQSGTSGSSNSKNQHDSPGHKHSVTSTPLDLPKAPDALHRSLPPLPDSLLGNNPYSSPLMEKEQETITMNPGKQSGPYLFLPPSPARFRSPVSDASALAESQAEGTRPTQSPSTSSAATPRSSNTGVYSRPAAPSGMPYRSPSAALVLTPRHFLSGPPPTPSSGFRQATPQYTPRTSAVINEIDDEMNPELDIEEFDNDYGDYPPTASYTKYFYINPQTIHLRDTINRKHQQNVIRRNTAIDGENAFKAFPLRKSLVVALTNQIASSPGTTRLADTLLASAQTKKTRIISSISTSDLPRAKVPSNRRTFDKSLGFDLTRILRDLQEPYSSLPIPTIRRKRPISPNSRFPPIMKSLDIHEISAHAFEIACTRSPENELFTCTFQEIDSLLNQRLLEQNREVEISTIEKVFAKTNQNLNESVLKLLTTFTLGEPFASDKYAFFYNIFSKQESNILPLHCIYNYVITFENSTEISLGYSPFYKMSIDKLEAVKIYLTDNLAKGFIESSQAPFAVLILFIKKADGNLRLCIDYRKFNTLICKDRYLLPLIDETLACLQGAKIYMKLDIR